jgi:hypothetical protein
VESIFAVAMSPGTRGTLLVLGGLGTLYSLAWALDFRGWTTSHLMFFYRNWGRWLWPGGNEKSYVAFNRFGGWLGVAIFAVLLVTGIRG